MKGSLHRFVRLRKALIQRWNLDAQGVLGKLPAVQINRCECKNVYVLHLRAEKMTKEAEKAQRDLKRRREDTGEEM